MKYTFEITISGCATNCGHCYVNGGPGAQMKTEDAIYCTDRIASAFRGVEGDRYITFGNENFCHKHVTEIFSHIHGRYPEFFAERETMPTTGIALLKRPDRDDVFEDLKACGVRNFELTIHGEGARHDAVVRRKGAYESLLAAAKVMKEKGFGLYFNLMVSKSLVNGIEEVLKRISELSPLDVFLTVPLYVPTPRMRAYEANRAGYEECLIIADAAEKWGMDASHLRKCAQNHSLRNVERLILSGKFDYTREKAHMPDWKFFNVDRKLDVFYGNVGMHTSFLGNMRHMTDEEIRRCILELPSNYDYTAFFPDSAFENIPIASGIKENPVYPSMADCIYAMLDRAGVENIII